LQPSPTKTTVRYGNLMYGSLFDTNASHGFAFNNAPRVSY
jgi:hypothetical protein